MDFSLSKEKRLHSFFILTDGYLLLITSALLLGGLILGENKFLRSLYFVILLLLVIADIGCALAENIIEKRTKLLQTFNFAIGFGVLTSLLFGLQFLPPTINPFSIFLRVMVVIAIYSFAVWEAYGFALREIAVSLLRSGSRLGALRNSLEAFVELELNASGPHAYVHTSERRARRSEKPKLIPEDVFLTVTHLPMQVRFRERNKQEGSDF